MKKKLFAIFLALNIRKSLHMFQLNSYKLATHMRWLRRNLSCLIWKKEKNVSLTS